MPDLEKVIKGLECHCNPYGCRLGCPYWDRESVPLRDCDSYQLYKDALELLKEQEPTGWVSVQDRLPDKDGRYLCLFHDWVRVVGFALNLSEFDEYDFAGKERPGWYDYDSEVGYYELTGTTHWMPLPEPPEEVSGDG